MEELRFQPGSLTLESLTYPWDYTVTHPYPSQGQFRGSYQSLSLPRWGGQQGTRQGSRPHSGPCLGQGRGRAGKPQDLTPLCLPVSLAMSNLEDLGAHRGPASCWQTRTQNFPQVSDLGGTRWKPWAPLLSGKCSHTFFFACNSRGPWHPEPTQGPGHSIGSPGTVGQLWTPRLVEGGVCNGHSFLLQPHREARGMQQNLSTLKVSPPAGQAPQESG